MAGILESIKNIIKENDPEEETRKKQDEYAQIGFMIDRLREIANTLEKEYPDLYGEKEKSMVDGLLRQYKLIGLKWYSPVMTGDTRNIPEALQPMTNNTTNQTIPQDKNLPPYMQVDIPQEPEPQILKPVGMMEKIYARAIKEPFYSYSGEAAGALGATFNTLDAWAEFIHRKTGLSKKDAFSKVARIFNKYAEEAVKRGMDPNATGLEGVARDVVKALGQTTIQLPEIIGLGLPAYSALTQGGETIATNVQIEDKVKGALAVLENPDKYEPEIVQAAKDIIRKMGDKERNVLWETLKGMGKGYLFEKYFKALSPLPRAERVAASAATGYAMAKGQGAKESEAIANALIFGGLSYPGPKGKEYRDQFYRNIKEFYTDKAKSYVKKRIERDVDRLGGWNKVLEKYNKPDDIRHQYARWYGFKKYYRGPNKQEILESAKLEGREPKRLTAPEKSTASERPQAQEKQSRVETTKYITEPENAAETQREASERKSKKERIINAVVEVDGRLYKGKTHGEAIDKAVKDKKIRLDENGNIDRDFSNPNIDLFETNTGRIVDRFGASSEFGVSASEQLPQKEHLKQSEKQPSAKEAEKQPWEIKKEEYYKSIKNAEDYLNDREKELFKRRNKHIRLIYEWGKNDHVSMRDLFFRGVYNREQLNLKERSVEDSIPEEKMEEIREEFLEKELSDDYYDDYLKNKIKEYIRDNDLPYEYDEKEEILVADGVNAAGSIGEVLAGDAAPDARYIIEFKGKNKGRNLYDDGYIAEPEEIIRIYQIIDRKGHKEIVEQALKEGKPVPAEVLKDYPDLFKKYKADLPRVETVKEPSAKKQASPASNNPYLKMPIERVRADAKEGVKLAQEALKIREKKGGEQDASRVRSDEKEVLRGVQEKGQAKPGGLSKMGQKKSGENLEQPASRRSGVSGKEGLKKNGTKSGKRYFIYLKDTKEKIYIPDDKVETIKLYVEGFEDKEFIIHPEYSPSLKGFHGPLWVVTEPLSGATIASGFEKKWAIDAAKDFLKYYGREKIDDKLKAIAETTKKYKEKENAPELPSNSDRVLEGEQSQAVQSAQENQPTGQSGGRESEADERNVEPSDRGRERTSTVVSDRDRTKRSPVLNKSNYRIKDDDLSFAEQSSFNKVERAKANIEAIRVLKKIEEENRPATKAEKQTLVKYVGWGGIVDIFEPYHWDKKWDELHNELDKLLTSDEWEAARASTPNAHYTSPEAIKAIWDIAKRLGFKGGNVLEPSLGVGHFFGLMPPAMSSKSYLNGVELDSISGRIARLLYPEANIQVKGFEEVFYPDNYFDLIVSNIPFGNYQLFDTSEPDADYNKLKLSIHNFFFAKSLAKVKPGGAIIFITSHFTLDAKNKAFRDYLSKQAEFIGAIRLPNTAFKGNAGTEVVTDIIILRKRLPGEGKSKFDKTDWIETVPRKVYNKYNQLIDIHVNKYFVDHPEMVLGTISGKGSMYSGDAELTVEPPDKPLEELLPEAIKKLPRNVIKAQSDVIKLRQQKEATPKVPEEELKKIKESGHFIKDGKIYRKEKNDIKEVKVAAKDKLRIKGLLDIRDAAKELLAKEMETDGDISKEMKKLNDVYDKFVKKYGHINSPANKKVLGDDPDFPFLQALEQVNDETGELEKSDIFKIRVYHKQPKIEHVDSPKDGYVASLNFLGRLDLDYIQELSGLPRETIVKELIKDDLIYYDPEENDYVTTEEYLSGNVRKKLKVAEVAAKDNPDLKRNVEALKGVLPKWIKFSEIEVNLGAPWIEPRIIEQFIDDITGTDSKVEVRYLSQFAQWVVQKKKTSYYEINELANNVANNQTYGTQDFTFIDLLEKILNHRQIVVIRSDSDGNKYIDQQATQAAREKADKIKEEFKDWLWRDAGRRQKLETKYNEYMNAFVPRRFNGSHLTFPGMRRVLSNGKKFEPYKHQVNAIWRVIQNRTALLDHVVGAGKTWEMIISAMELKRMGIIKKPMFVIPNHMVRSGQFAREFRQLYPDAKLLIADEKTFAKKNRNVFMSKIATGDWDGIIIGHSSFDLLPVTDETFNQFIQEQIDELELLIQQTKSEKISDKRLIKEAEKAKQRLKAKLRKGAAQHKKDKTVYFEELGIDQLYVDEAHNYKNLPFVTKMNRVAGVGANTQSQRAINLMIKIRHIFERNKQFGPDKGVVFATGTPVSNRAVEIFIMQKYLQPTLLKKLGIDTFDAWAHQFGNIITRLEVAPEGTGFRVKESFSSLINLPELMKIYTQVADIKKLDDLPEVKNKAPKIRGGKVKVIENPPSQAQLEFLDEMKIRAEKIRSKLVDPSEDNMLKVTTDGRKAFTNMRLIDPAYPDEPDSKINMAVEAILKEWQDSKSIKGTQLVFLDLGTPKKGEFNLYDDIKTKLVAKGVPAKDIAFIHDANTPTKREALIKKFRNGDVRIIIGSTSKMGEGMNAQDRIVAIHHLDAPFKPAHIEQRNGRGLRVGNMNDEVAIYTYVTKGEGDKVGFDSFLWQKLETKARFIKQASTADTTIRKIEMDEDVELSYGEIKAIATGNPLVMEKIELEQKLNALMLSKRAFERTRTETKVMIPQVERSIKNFKDRIKEEELKINSLPGKEVIVLNGKEFDLSVEKSKKEAYKILTETENALKEEVLSENRPNVERQKTIGKYGDFDVVVKAKTQINKDQTITAKATVYLRHNKLDSYDSVDYGRAFAKMRSKFEEWKRFYSDALESNKKKLSDLKKELQNEFEHEEEIKKLQERLKEIDKSLSGGDREDSAGSEETPGVVLNMGVNPFELAKALLPEPVKNNLAKLYDRFIDLLDFVPRNEYEWMVHERSGAINAAWEHARQMRELLDEEMTRDVTGKTKGLSREEKKKLHIFKTALTFFMELRPEGRSVSPDGLPLLGDGRPIGETGLTLSEAKELLEDAIANQKYEYQKEILREAVRMLENPTPLMRKWRTIIKHDIDADREILINTNLLHTFYENYINHIWKVDNKGNLIRHSRNKLNTKFENARKRKIPSYLHGLALGFEPVTLDPLKLNEIRKKTMAAVIANKAFLDYLSGLEIDGLPALATKKFVESNHLQDMYQRLPDNPMLQYFVYIGGSKKVKVNLSGTRYYKTPEGMNVVFVGVKEQTRDNAYFVSTTYYAHKGIAGELKKIYEPSVFKRSSFLYFISRINQFYKLSKLAFSGFHHIALGMNNLFLGGKYFGNPLPWNILGWKSVHKEGLKALKNFNPVLYNGIRQGLTLNEMGSRADYYRLRNKIKEAWDRLDGKKFPIKRLLGDFKDWWDEGLWNNYYAGSKAMAYMVQYGLNLRRFQNVLPELYAEWAELGYPMEGLTTYEQMVAKITARDINQLYGGLPQDMMRISESAWDWLRTFFLAPDWQISNWSYFFNAIRYLLPTSEKSKVYYLNGKKIELTGKTEGSNIGYKLTKGAFRTFIKAFFIITLVQQVINWLTTKDDPDGPKTTFQNPVGYRNMTKMFEYDGRAYYVDLGRHFWEPFKLYKYYNADDPLSMFDSALMYLRTKSSAFLRTASELYSMRDWRGRPFADWEHLKQGKLTIGKYTDERYSGSKWPGFLVQQGLNMVPIWADLAFRAVLKDEPWLVTGFSVLGIHVKVGPDDPRVSKILRKMGKIMYKIQTGTATKLDYMQLKLYRKQLEFLQPEEAARRKAKRKLKKAQREMGAPGY